MMASMTSAGVASDAIALGAVGVVIKVTLLIGFAGILAVLLRGASAAARHQVWMLAIVSSLLVPILAFVPGPLVRIPSHWLPVKQSKPETPAATKRSTVTAQSSAQRPETVQGVVKWFPRPRATPGVQPSALMNANLEDLLPKRPIRNRTVILKDGRATIVEFDLRAEPNRQRDSTRSKVVPAGKTPPDGADESIATIIALWATGAGALLLWRLLGFALLARVVRQSVPVTRPDWQAALTRCMSESGALTPVRLLAHHSFSTPVTAGWRRPVIILPADIGSTSPERQRAVLAHELAHVRRRDYVTQALAAIATSLYWFHPLVWMAAARMRAESECAADDSVLGRGMEPEHYARHLLALAGRTTGPMPIVGMARITQLEQRLRAMLNANVSRSEPSRSAQRWTALLSLMVVTPYASLRVVTVAEATNNTVAITSKPKLPAAAPLVPGNAPPAEPARSQSIAPGVSVWPASGVPAGQLVASLLSPTRTEPQPNGYRADSSEDVLLHPASESVSVQLSTLAAASDSVVEQSLPMNNGESLTLSVQFGANVIVRGWDQPQVRMRAALGGSAWRQAHARMYRNDTGVLLAAISEREGFRVAQRAEDHGYIYLRAPGPVPVPPSVDHVLEVWVPRRTNIKLSSLLGDFSIQDVEGTLSGELKTGDLEISNANGSAIVTTELGDLRIANSVLSGQASTQCGTVTLAGVTGGVSATSQFDPASMKDAGKLMIVDGIVVEEYCNLRLRRFGTLRNRVNENNPYGDIVIDSAPTGGTLSTGRGGSITVRASGGHISAGTRAGNIELSNVRGDATAMSVSGDITIRLINAPGADHYVNARTTGGTITIELPDSLDAQIQAEVAVSDSSGIRKRNVSIRDEYGLSRDPSAQPGIAGGPGALAASMRATRGSGTGRIVLHVTDGDIILKRAKR